MGASPALTNESPAHVHEAEETYDIRLPIRYREAEAVMAFFPAPTPRIREILPSDKVRPVEAAPGRSLLAVVAFEYRDTDIGPYNELGICVPILFRSPIAPPLVPLALEKWYPRLGFYIHHLPVTTDIARWGGRHYYGYPKFVADIGFDESDRYRTCHLSEGGRTILDLTVEKVQKRKREKRDFVTYSILGEEILKTVIHADLDVGSARLRGAVMRLGHHPVSEEIRMLEASPRALEVRYMPRMESVLPAPCERFAL